MNVKIEEVYKMVSRTNKLFFLLMIVGLWSVNVYADCKMLIEKEGIGFDEAYTLCPDGKLRASVNRSNTAIDVYLMARAVDPGQPVDAIKMNIKLNDGKGFHIGTDAVRSRDVLFTKEAAGRWWIFFPDNQNNAMIYTGNLQVGGPYYVEYTNLNSFPIEFGHCMNFSEGCR